MPKVIKMMVFSLMSCALVAPCRGASKSLQGNWVGEFKLKDESTFIKVNYRSEKDGIKAVADMPPLGPMGLTLHKLSVQSARVHFEIGVDSERLVFNGALKDNALSGSVRKGAVQGTFQMIRLAEVGSPLLARYSGTYQTASGKFIWVGRFGEFGGDNFFIDYDSGRFGPVYPLAEATFFSGQTIVAPLFPVDVRITFIKDKRGEVTGLNYRRGNLAEVHAAKIPLKQEEVSFRSGDVTLAGTLTIPVTKGPHPALVLIHGSGPEDRDFIGPWAHFFARQGIVVLAYDKRGVGASTGDWKRANFDDLTGDVLAGVRWLKGRGDVNPKQIGLWGVSQGGWIAPLAAARSRDIAFILLHAAPSVTVMQQGQIHFESELRAYGLPEDEIKAAMAYRKLDDEFTRTGQGWEALQDAYQKAKARNAEWVDTLLPKDDWFRAFYRQIMEFDPVPFLEKVTCPVLAFFGEVDTAVPPQPNKKIMEAALRKGGNPDVTLIVLPKANHVFLKAETGVRTEVLHLKEFVTEYFDTLSRWLVKRLNLGK